MFKREAIAALVLCLCATVTVSPIDAQQQHMYCPCPCRDSTHYVCTTSPQSACYATTDSCHASCNGNASCVPSSAYCDNCPRTGYSVTCQGCFDCLRCSGSSINFCLDSKSTRQQQCYQDYVTCNQDCAAGCVNNSIVVPLGDICDDLICPSPLNNNVVKGLSCQNCLSSASTCYVPALFFCYRGTKDGVKHVDNLCFPTQEACDAACDFECVSETSQTSSGAGGDVCTSVCNALPEDQCNTADCVWCGSFGRDFCTFNRGGSLEEVCRSCRIMPLDKCPAHPADASLQSCRACASSNACIPATFTELEDDTLGRQSESAAISVRVESQCSVSSNNTFSYCGVFTNQLTCEWPNVKGVPPSTTDCQWCPSSDPSSSSHGRCINGQHSCADPCTSLSRGDCSPPSCKWCVRLGVCIATNVSCECLRLPGDELCERANASCLLAPAVLAFVDGKRYCDARSTCPPLTCTSITDKVRCRAAGCSVKPLSGASSTSGTTDRFICSAGKCWSFFLPSFEPFAYVLFVLGFCKDIFVLTIVIGVFGSVFMRRIDSIVIAAKRLCCCCCGDTPPLTCCITTEAPVETMNDVKTVYIADEYCRDGHAFSFSQYAAAVARTLFELPNGLAPRQLAKMHDAVAYALLSSKTWIRLTPSNTNSSNLRHNSAPLLTKLQLSSSDFDSIVTLQGKVDRHVILSQDAVVYYSNSRDASRAAAIALNSFPTAVSLMLYIVTLGILMLTALYDVVGVESHRHDVEAIARGCINTSSSIDNMSATSPPPSMMMLRGAAANTTNVSHDDAATVTRASTTIFQAAFLLVGYRFVNGSQLSTCLLVLVKTVRALYVYFFGNYHSLPLVRRLPLVGFLTSRFLQAAVLLYFLMVSAFLFAPITWGAAHVSSLCAVPVIVAASVTLVLGVTVKLVSFLRQRQRQHSFQEDADEEASMLLGADIQAVARGGDASSSFDLKISASSDDARTRSDNAAPASPHHLPRSSEGTGCGYFLTALAEFFCKEELLIVFFTIAVCTGFNVMCILAYKEQFGVTEEKDAFQIDYDARSAACVFERYKERLSAKLAVASSFVPFM